MADTDAACTALHPTKAELHCNRAALKPHEKHSAYCWDENGYVSWPNDSFEPNKVQQQAQQKRENDAQQSASRKTLRSLAAKIRDTL